MSDHSRSELYKYPWYHGNITRELAESLMTTEGDFLLRDSTSQPGDYVLTCCWGRKMLHFVVNRKLDKETAKVQYQFEEVLFDRVTELVHFYVSKKKPISSTSGVVISAAVPRPNLYDGSHHSQHRYNRSLSSTGHSPCISPLVSPVSSPPLTRHNIHQRSGSQPLLLSDVEEFNNELPRGSLPHSSPKFVNKLQRRNPLSHVYSDPILVKSSISADVGNVSSANAQCLPPQTHVLPTEKAKGVTHSTRLKPRVAIRNHALYEDDGKDYSDYDQVKSWPGVIEARQRQEQAQEHNPVLTNEPDAPLEDREHAATVFTLGNDVEDDCIPVCLKPAHPTMTLPPSDPISCFDLENFRSAEYQFELSLCHNLI